MEITLAEVTERIVRYYVFAWKLAVPDLEPDTGESIINRGSITTVIPIGGNTDNKFTSTIYSSVYRTRSILSNERSTVNFYLSNEAFPKAIIAGFYKINITDKDGKILPKKTIYVTVNSEQLNHGNVESAIGNFGIITRSEIPGNKLYARFELHIEVSEIENSDFDRQKNDLSILLDESLLTDSVLRVSGKEIPVHRAILAARWPSFYEKFLAESKDPVVDVGEIDPDVFTQLLQCVYSKRIPDSLFKDGDCIDLASTLEQTWFLEQIQASKPPQRSSSNIIPVFDHRSTHKVSTKSIGSC